MDEPRDGPRRDREPEGVHGGGVAVDLVSSRALIMTGTVLGDGWDGVLNSER